MGYFLERFAQVVPLDGLKPLFFGVPEAAALLVIENEGVPVRPARGSQCQGFAVHVSAVHSRQVYQRSVGRGNRCPGQCRVEDLVTGQDIHRNRPGVIFGTKPDDPRPTPQAGGGP
ncbi:hypothetical protein SAMN05216233_112123 [Desulfoluna spongiiphila]|uniref:Uncharacterized protein n=1 Tax=Desulfoluna spongiiphila TaxID=419481 RepID=A0A1G5H4M2_9BACT|nr:hypothetical protein SAMN05216233_112123 [Desulfoluna spongiiphila]